MKKGRPLPIALRCRVFKPGQYPTETWRTAMPLPDGIEMDTRLLS